jgi:signal transduction histidine kinase
MRVWKGRLELRISDNGRGFDPSTADTGNGLVNMQRRATRLGAKLELQSEPGRGTDLKLTVSLPSTSSTR